MLIYNTLTKKKEEFETLEPNKVKMYTCGPTVYDYFHIGNARSFVMADVIIRYLEYKGFEVTSVMNLTDIDDKIIKKSIEENVDASVIAKKYSEAFFEDIEKLKIRKADIYPKATDHIDSIVKLIEKLENRGIAYNIDGNVFYDISKFDEYGKLSGKNIDELEAGSRVEVNDNKKNPLDFSLWKKAKEGEPAWDSPWGKGRPGWHIECSAMSIKHLGDSIDIHAGGSDLIFPHHENEIAQSEASFEHKHNFVNYWMHFGFLNIQNEKMSKSLGNFFTTREVLQRYSAEVLRLFYCQAHYASPLNFSPDLLDSTQKGLEKISNLYQLLNNEISNVKESGASDFNFKFYYDEFEKVMDDDFNSPKGIAVIFDFVRDINKFISSHNELSGKFYQQAKEFLDNTANNVFSIINLESESNNASLEKDLMNLLIEIRRRLKESKNYDLADLLRNRLNDIGIILQDSKDGTIYKKQNRSV